MHLLPIQASASQVGFISHKHDCANTKRADTPRHYSSEQFCYLCDATQTGPLGYANFAADAAHRATLMDHLMYLGKCVAECEEPSTIFESPGVGLKHVAIDVMHSGDLGPFADAVGSLFYLEIMNKDWYPCAAAGIHALNTELRDYDRANPTFSPCTLTRFMIMSKDPGFPSLKAKAAHTRQ